MATTDAEYLAEVVKQHSLEDDSEELKELRDARDRVELVLRDKFGTIPTIRYGGSHAKGTMVATAYDLDLLCYFPNDSKIAGETLEEIYENVKEALEKKYTVKTKRSSLRLHDGAASLRIDVVPGRFVDETKTDVFLHQNAGNKERLKTNPDVHIEHVRDSKVRDAIKLAKVWRDTYAITAKTFVLELLLIKLLKERKNKLLDAQLLHVFEQFRDNADELTVEDPANSGNDLGPILDEARSSLESGGEQALALVAKGWKSLFTESKKEAAPRSARVKVAAENDPTRVKPWAK